MKIKSDGKRGLRGNGGKEMSAGDKAKGTARGAKVLGKLTFSTELRGKVLVKATLTKTPVFSMTQLCAVSGV